MPTVATNLPDRLVSILGPHRIHSDPSARANYTIDEIIPSAIATPATAEEAAEVVRFALKENLSIIPCGSRTKIQIGNPPTRYDIALDMTALNQIANYDPGDLTVSIDAGCTLQTIAATLAPQNQFLPLPSAYGPRATVAGTIASGLDSHLRQFFGTARDFLIGAEFIDGTGASTKSGGRVVKNVTGYDLHKLLIGSLGTLAIITRLNFRTFPALISADSQTETFTAQFPDANAALTFRDKIAASIFTPDAVEILSPEAIAILEQSAPGNSPQTSIDQSVATPNKAPLQSSPANHQPQWLTLVAFHGSRELRVRYSTALSEFSQQEGIKSSNDSATAAFNAIQHFRNASPDATIFKITQLPAKLPTLFAALTEVARHSEIPHAIVARGIGVAYFALLPRDPLKTAWHAAAELDRQTMEPLIAARRQQSTAHLLSACNAAFSTCVQQSATAQIQFAPAELKRQLNILGPERPDAAAMRRLKYAFDPQNIFAPGRLL
jgi:glycolate oxidase FAD binding subunit